MKKENMIVWLILAAIVAYLTWPHLRGGFSFLRGKITNRKSIITGTASKGDDSGGVLTSAGECS